ncbi:MAG: peptidoglycan DD-metalloendopeptidase family protein [Bacteroidetes bacterium]|nr:peptidoglycan DD-metalloendopeptidase family protein [Bacteroidota bacterium]
MPKAKYFFNPNTLSYEKHKKGFKYYFWRSLIVLVMSLGFAFAIFFFFTGIVDSPKETMLKSENAELKEQLSQIEKQVQSMSNSLDELTKKDAEIYRIIFEAEPLSQKTRKAGIGGADRYNYLRNLTGNNFLIEMRKSIDNLQARMRVQQQSYEEIIKLAENKKRLLAAIPSIQPVANKDLKRVASGYGYRIDPFYRTRKFHSGLDFSAPRGTEVYATADGTVEDVSNDLRGYGKHIIINHGYGYKTLYGHLSKFEVKRGQTITRGQLIGRVGSTGKSTGPHLHYEVHINGNVVNPTYFFHNDLTDEEFRKLVELASLPNQSFD